jgi:hypothetical protein
VKRGPVNLRALLRVIAISLRSAVPHISMADAISSCTAIVRANGNNACNR